MRFVRLVAAAATIIGATGVAAAQGTMAPPREMADPAKTKAIDEAYRGQCEAKAPKALCACVIEVAGVNVNDPVERQVFFDYMMGEVDKAKATRAMFSPDQNMKFNIALQKADTMLGSECDKLKPKAEPAQPKAQ
jgi:hypothetical protein